MTAMIDLRDVRIRYGTVEVVRSLSLRIENGEFFTLLGPSGCGKTTILRAIAGFVPLSGGSILLDGQDVSDVPAERRNVGIVFQNYALFPHMTVEDNVAFGLKAAKKKKNEIADAVARILDATGISFHRDKKPAELSGGQQQRVAIARSLVMGTQILLFDEPLSNLDAKIRENMRHEIKKLQRDLGFTAVFVSHDQEEALSMSDRLLVFNHGKVEQVGTARELYESPATPFVCQFVGSANKLGPAIAGALGMAEKREMYVRPEHISLCSRGGTEAVEAVVRDVDYIGATTRVFVDVDGESLCVHTFSGPSTASLARGQDVAIRIEANKVLKFEAK